MADQRRQQEAAVYGGEAKASLSDPPRPPRKQGTVPFRRKDGKINLSAERVKGQGVEVIFWIIGGRQTPGERFWHELCMTRVLEGIS